MHRTSMSLEPGRIAHVDILGVRVAATTMDTAVSVAQAWVAARERHFVTFTTVHTLIECRRDSTLATVYSTAGMNATDGMPLVWSCRAAGVQNAQRVYGPDFMLKFCQQSVPLGFAHYFFGGPPGVAARLAQRLNSQISGLRVVGAHSPPYGDLTDHHSQHAELINGAKPDCVWVGLGSPKQDRWMAKMRNDLTAPVLFGVGAAFDFH